MQSFLIHKWDHDQYFHKHEVMLMSFSGRLFTGRRLGRCAPKIPMTSTGFLPYPRLGRSSSLRSSCGQEDAWRSSTWDRYIYIYNCLFQSVKASKIIYTTMTTPAATSELEWNGSGRHQGGQREFSLDYKLPTKRMDKYTSTKHMNKYTTRQSWSWRSEVSRKNQRSNFSS